MHQLCQLLYLIKWHSPEEGIRSKPYVKQEGTSSCEADSRTRRAYSVRTIGDLPPTWPGIP